jgi:hypothetical protein
MDEVIVFLSMYVYDCFVIADKTSFLKSMEEIGKHFEVKRSQEINNFI